MADIRETGTSGLKYGEGTLNNNSSEINFEELMSSIGSLKRASAKELNSIFKPSYSEPIGVKLAQAGYGNSVYDENAVSDWDLDNLNEVRAANQPGILLLGNGALKMVSTGVTTFLDSTVGALYGLGTGIANAAAAEEGERGEAFIRGLWDNDFNRAMTSIQDGMEELLPNYYSLDELNSPWYSNILSANFIGDKVLKNMGFTIGALGAMALTGGVGGIAGKSVLAASKFALGNLGKALGVSRGTLAGINNFARGAGQFSNWLVNTAISANGEAAIEAINALKEGLKDAYANLDSRRLELINNLDPNSPDYFTKLSAIDNASLEYKDEIDRQFRDAGNSVYLANLAILGASNTLEFGHILKGGFGKSAKLADYELRANGEKVALSDWIKAGIRGDKIGIENTINKGFGRIAGITAKNILTEGTEEATQNLASNTAKLLAKAKGNEFAENSILGARINPEVTDELTDYTKAFSKALYDNFGSPESPGWEEFFLGGLTGGMGFMSLGKVKQKDAEGNYVIDPKTLKVMTKLRPIWEGGFMQAKRQVLEEYEDNQRIVDAVNKRLQDPEFIKRFQHSVASQKFSEDMSAALERNDMVEFKNSDMGRITNDVFFFRDAGMIDEYKSLYKQMAQGIDDKTLEQLYTATADENGNTALAQEDTEKVRKEYQDKALRMLDKIEMVQQYYDFVDLDYRDRSPLFKEELAYLYVRLDDTNRRIKQLKEKKLSPNRIKSTLLGLIDESKILLDEEGNPTTFKQDYEDSVISGLTESEEKDLERLERQKKQYEEKIKEYTKNPEKLDRDINLAYLEGEAKRASLDALSLIKQLKEAKTAKEVDSIIAFADESVREEVWKAAYQDGDDEVKEKIEMAIETLNAFAKTKERLQKVFRGTPEIAEVFEAMMRNLYINNELNPEKIREAMKALQQGIESENPDALSQYTNAFDLVADNLFGEGNKKTRDLTLNFLESSQEQLGNTLRELQKYKTARETLQKVQQLQQQQQQLLQAAQNQQQQALTNKNHLGKVLENKTLKKAISKGTHVAVKKFGKDTLNDIIDKVITKGNFEGSETDVEAILNALSNVFQDKMGKERSDSGIQDTINRFSNSNINPYRKAVGLILQTEYKSTQQPPQQPALLPAQQQPALQPLSQQPLQSQLQQQSVGSKTNEEWGTDNSANITRNIANSEFKESYTESADDTYVNNAELPKLKATADYLNGKLSDREYLKAMGLSTGKGSWLDSSSTTPLEIADMAKKKSEPRKKYLKHNQAEPETFKVLDKNVETLLEKFYKKLGREPLTFTMDELRQIAQNMAKALSLVTNGLSVSDDLKAYEDIILANKTDNNLPALTENNPSAVGGDEELNGAWVSLYDVSSSNPLKTEHEANLANEQNLTAHYGSVENAKKVQWVIDYLLKDIKDAPVNLITSVGEFFPNGKPKTTIYTAIKVSDIRGDLRKKIARHHGWILEIDGEDYLVIGILGVSGSNQAQLDNYDSIRADLDNQISDAALAIGWWVSNNPSHIMQITNIGDGRFAMHHFEENEWNSDDIVELLTGPNKEISNPLLVDPKKGQLKFSIEYTEGSKFVNKSNKDVVRRGSANLEKGKMYVLIPTPNGAYYRFPIKEVTIDESKDNYKQNGSDNKLVKEVDRLIDRIIEKKEVKDIIALKNLLVLESETEELSFLDIYFDNGEIRVEYIPRRNEAHSKANKNSIFLDASNKVTAKTQLSDIIYNQIRPFINVNISNTSSWEGVKKLSEAGALRLKRPLAVFSFVGANYTVKPATTKKGSKPEEKRRRLNPVVNELQVNFNGRTIFLRDNNFYEKESLITDPKEIEILQDLVAINNGNYAGETIYKKKNKLLIPLQGTYYFVGRFVGRDEALYIYHKDANGNFTKLTGPNAAEILSKRKNKPSTATPSFTISVETASALLEEKMLREMNGGSSQNEYLKTLGLLEEDMEYYPQAKAWLDANWESTPYPSAFLRALQIGYSQSNRLIAAWKAEKNKPTGASSNGLGISVETATPELERAYTQNNTGTIKNVVIEDTINKLFNMVASAGKEISLYDKDRFSKADKNKIIEELKKVKDGTISSINAQIEKVLSDNGLAKYWYNRDAWTDLGFSGLAITNAVLLHIKANKLIADSAAPFIEGLNKATTNQLIAAILKSATDANIDGTISEEQFKRINETATAKLSLIARDNKEKTEARKADAVKRAIYDLEQKKGVKVGDTVEINGELCVVTAIEYDEGVASAPNNDIYGYSDIPGTVVLRLSNSNTQYSYGVTRFLNGANNKKINKQSQKSLKGLDNSNNSSTFVGRLKVSSDNEGQSLLNFLYKKVNAINESKGTKIDADDLTVANLIKTYKDTLGIDLLTLPSNITLELLEYMINCKL